MELALPWLKLVGILVSGIVGCVLTLRFAIAAVWWAKKNAADGASFMFSTYLGNGPWWSESGTNPSAPQHGLWSQFTDLAGREDRRDERVPWFDERRRSGRAPELERHEPSLLLWRWREWEW